MVICLHFSFIILFICQFSIGGKAEERLYAVLTTKHLEGFCLWNSKI